MAQKRVKIYIGENKDQGTYHEENLKDCKAVLTSGLQGDILTVDTLTFTVNNGGGSALYSHDNLRNLPAGTPVWYYADNPEYTWDNNLIGKFYADSVSRTGKDDYTVSCISAVGLLTDKQHNGGIITRATFQQLMADIIGQDFAYTIQGTALQGLVFIGWLPIATARENLQQVLFACGAMVTKDAQTGAVIFKYPNTAKQGTIPKSRIFLGGTSQYATAPSKVSVTCHTFNQSSATEAEAVFDNSSETTTVTNKRIDFSEPFYDFQTSGNITLNTTHSNYIVVTGKGTVTAKKYLHTQQIYAITNENAVKTNEITVTDATLVSGLNVANVAARVMAYNSNSETITEDIILEAEKTGTLITTFNGYGEQTDAYIEQIETNSPTSFIRAKTKMTAGYTPTGLGNSMSHRQEFLSSGSITVPSGIDRVLAVLIGGGQGGQGGGKGADGESYMQPIEQSIAGGIFIQSGTNGGAGGTAGQGGKGGNVLAVYLDVTAGSTATFTIGQGGAGGARNGGIGTLGTATTLTYNGTTYTSADGTPAEFYDLVFTRPTLFGGNGEDGYRGGNGGKGGLAGESAQDHRTTSSGASAGSAYTVTALQKVLYGGGGGGGAVPTAVNAQRGETLSEARTQGSADILVIYCADGGNGATTELNPNAPETTRNGRGGKGGNGGGGGGGVGGYIWKQTQYRYMRGLGTAGLGQDGTKGRAGENGVVIIYY